MNSKRIDGTPPKKCQYHLIFTGELGTYIGWWGRELWIYIPCPIAIRPRSKSTFHACTGVIQYNMWSVYICTELGTYIGWLGRELGISISCQIAPRQKGQRVHWLHITRLLDIQYNRWSVHLYGTGNINWMARVWTLNLYPLFDSTRTQRSKSTFHACKGSYSTTCDLFTSVRNCAGNFWMNFTGIRFYRNFYRKFYRN